MNSIPLKFAGKEYSDKVMLKFWNTMTSIFLGKWTKQIGATPSSVWAKGLGDLSADEIAVGLGGVDALGRQSGGWPPNLIEFRELCRPDVNRPACHLPGKAFAALPKPDKITSPADAQVRIAAIRQILTGSSSTVELSQDESDAEFQRMQERQRRAFEQTVNCQWRKPSYKVVKLEATRMQA